MNPTRSRPSKHERATAEARELLEEQWRRRVDEVTQLSINLHDARAALTLTAGDGSHLVEVELLENHLVAARRALVEVEAALVRLGDGTYGVCAECKEPIAAERLEVLPEARLCTPCQSASRSARR